MPRSCARLYLLCYSTGLQHGVNCSAQAQEPVELHGAALLRQFSAQRPLPRGAVPARTRAPRCSRQAAQWWAAAAWGTSEAPRRPSARVGIPEAPPTSPRCCARGASSRPCPCPREVIPTRSRHRPAATPRRSRPRREGSPRRCRAATRAPRPQRRPPAPYGCRRRSGGARTRATPARLPLPPPPPRPGAPRAAATTGRGSPSRGSWPRARSRPPARPA